MQFNTSPKKTKFDDPDEKVVAFINKYISCQLTDEEMDPDLHNIVEGRAISLQKSHKVVKERK